MFYSPFSLRRQTTHLVPKGPGLDWAPTLRTCVNGSEMTIKGPRNKSRSPVKPRNPRATYNLRDNDFTRAVTDKSGWETFPLISRRWDFNGAWFTGNLGELGMFVSVMKPLKPALNVSLFHPRAFEAAIADLMSYYHGDEFSRNNTVQDWLAPVGWQPRSNLPCIAAKFDATTNPEVRTHQARYRYLFLPLSDQYLLQISLPITRTLPFIHSDETPEKDTDKWISEEPMKILADQIIDSFQIRLSPEAEQQQAKALEGLSENEKALVKEFPPLKWV